MTDIVFISYSRIDIKVAKRIYSDLEKDGYQPWIDEDRLDIGSEWEFEIKNQIDKCRFFLPIFSFEALGKDGYFHREIRMAIERSLRKAPGRSFILPVRIDECQISYSELQKFHVIDLFPDYNYGLNEIIKFLAKSSEEDFRKVSHRKEINSSSTYFEKLLNEVKYLPIENLGLTNYDPTYVRLKRCLKIAYNRLKPHYSTI